MVSLPLSLVVYHSGMEVVMLKISTPTCATDLWFDMRWNI